MSHYTVVFFQTALHSFLHPPPHSLHLPPSCSPSLPTPPSFLLPLSSNLSLPLAPLSSNPYLSSPQPYPLAPPFTPDKATFPLSWPATCPEAGIQYCIDVAYGLMEVILLKIKNNKLTSGCLFKIGPWWEYKSSSQHVFVKDWFTCGEL